jgi:creatinine amidohydrolase
MTTTHLYEELKPAEMQELVSATPLAYVPSGTLEWHSTHLPFGLDALKAHGLCKLAAEQSGGVVVPPVYWAVGGMPHPWTMRLESDLVEQLFTAILGQLGHVGFRVVVLLIGHYPLDHELALKQAALQVMLHSGLTVWALTDRDVALDEGYRGEHAARWETSLLWSLRPELVAMDRLPTEGPLDGVLGEDPRHLASQESGARMRDIIVSRMATMAGRLVHHTDLRQRSAFIEAIAGQVRLVEAITMEHRAKGRYARQLATDDYADMLLLLYKGDYAAAAERATMILHDLTGARS